MQRAGASRAELRGQGRVQRHALSSLSDASAKLLPNKHQLRTEETRRKLLKAAEKVFAKVGFEAARLEDIAKEAGHTRGAFYAHFTSKEDLFFALLEQKAHQHSANFQAITAHCKDDAERLHCLRDYYSNLASNRSWSTLTLEFKLFAARRPKLRAKLAARHRRIRASFRVEGQTWLEVSGTADGLCDGGRKTKVALEAFLHGLVLESSYDPVMLPKDEAAAMLGEVFDLLTGSRRAKSV